MNARTTVTILALLGWAPAAAAQEAPGPFSLILNAATAIPTHEFGGMAGAETGFAIEAQLGYRFVPAVSAEVGFSHSRYDCDTSLACGNGEYTVTGPDLGLTVYAGDVGAGIQPWVRAGGMWSRVDFQREEDGIEIRSHSDWTMGYRVGAGFDYPLGRGVVLRPNLSYSSFVVELDPGPQGLLTDDLEVSDLRGGLAIKIRR